MANASRGVISAPNQSSPGNRIHSSEARTSQAPGTHSPNDRTKAPIGSSGSQGRMASPITSTPNERHRFNVDQARMPDQPAAVTVGRGDIPVQPFGSSGNPLKSVPMRDSARGISKK